MKIRKAKEEDLKEYLKLKAEESKEYKIIIGEEIKIPPINKLTKEFNEFVESPNLIIFVVEENKKLIAYINSKIHKSFWSKRGYIDDLFVLKTYRKKGVATKLINEFIKFLEDKKINELQLSVSIKNKKAIELYEKLGFEIISKTMRKKLKC
jgi:ribosomal protein S18 acetylase RimI-like enzyme